MIITCGFYLFNSSNKFLIVHQTGFNPNVWSIPKGRIDSGENDYYNTAKRELMEETNINIENYDILKIEEFDIIRYKESNKYLKGFFVKVDSDFSDVELRCDSMVYRNGVPSFPEVDDYKWVTIEESKKYLLDFQFPNLEKCENLLVEKLKYITTFDRF